MKFFVGAVVILAACGDSRSDRAKSDRGESTSGRAIAAASPLAGAVGAAVATPGPLFEGLEVGGPADARAAEVLARWKAEQPTIKIHINFKTSGETIRELRVNTVNKDAEGCRQLRATLDKTWPAGASLGEVTVWFDPTKQQRAFASFRDDWCSLVFERYVTATEHVRRELLDLIGKPSALYKTTTAGLGPIGSGINAYTVVLDGDTIVGFTADGIVGTAEVDALRAHLDSLLGASAVIAGVAGSGFRWTKAPTATLTYRDDKYELTIGGLSAPTGPGRWTPDGGTWIYRFENRDEAYYGDDGRCRYLFKSRCPAGEDCPFAPELRLCPPLTADVLPAR